MPDPNTQTNTTTPEQALSQSALFSVGDQVSYSKFYPLSEYPDWKTVKGRIIQIHKDEKAARVLLSSSGFSEWVELERLSPENVEIAGGDRKD